MILMYPIGGVIADRVNKRNIMVILDFSTAALIFIFPILVENFSIIPLTMFAMIILYAIKGLYQPAVRASIPFLVDTKHLIQANSIFYVIGLLVNIIVPVLSGLFFYLLFFGFTPFLYISIFCFIVSAVMKLFLHIPFEEKTKQDNIIMTGLKDIQESFGFIFRQKPIICKICVTYCMVSLLLCSLFVCAFPILITQILDFSEKIATILCTSDKGIIAAGSITGGLLAGISAKKFKPKAILYLTMGCALSILMCAAALQFSNSSMIIYIILAVGCGILMIFSSLYQVQMMSYIQILTPKDLIGKVISFVICVCVCSASVGQFIYGFIFRHIGKYTYLPFYVAALLTVVIGIISFRLYNKINIEIEQKVK